MEKVIIFSAPSGSGKTTLVKHSLGIFNQLQFSISCTTRLPRGEEKHGVDYYFLTPEEFKEKISAQHFVEFEEVYTDKFYGTLQDEVQRIWDNNKIVIFDVDVKGGIALKKVFKEKALSVFIAPPNVAELEKRLINRATDSLETIKVRMDKAEEEMQYQNQFDVVVVNEDLDLAKSELESILHTFINS